MRAVIIKIFGDVQGVNYRYWAKQSSLKLGLTGWAKNEHDGSVTLYVQGLSGNVSKIIELAKDGSPLATVDEVIVTEAEIDSEIKGFSVK